MVECNLAMVDVASSSLVYRSNSGAKMCIRDSQLGVPKAAYADANGVRQLIEVKEGEA